MKRKCLFACLTLLLASGSYAQKKERNVQTSTMHCEVKGQLGKGNSWKKAYVSAATPGFGQVNYVDSVAVADGSFSFSIEQAAIPTLHMLKVVDANGVGKESLLFVDGDELSVSVDKKTGLLKVSGTEANEEYFRMEQEKKPLESQAETAWNRYKDSSLLRDVRLQAEGTMDSLDDLEMQIHLKYVRANPKSLLALTIAAQNCDQLGMTVSEQVLEKLPEMYKETPAYKRVARYVEDEHLCIPGDDYHDFSMKDINGHMVRLFDHAEQGNYIVLDFWASWCGPCRAEMPLMVELYHKYKDRGIEFIGVSLDKDEAAWKKAVKDMGMEWLQLSDLKGWDCHAARINGVRHIPYTILIAPNGRVMMKDVHGRKLMDILERWAVKK